MNEAETRAEHIDPALAKAGWGVVEGSRIRREYGSQHNSGLRCLVLKPDRIARP
jgi:type I site-specific restriction endonuclease